MEETSVLSTILGYWWVFALIVLVVGYKLWLRLLGIVIIPEDSIGLVNKKFVLFGSHRTLPEGDIIALQGEAGYQADTLPPGLHMWLWPWQYAITRQKFVTIKEGMIGVVESRDGSPLPNGRVLGKKIDCDSFQNTRKFLEQGGERGPQIAIIPPGTYRINTFLFTVTEQPVLEIEDNMLGIVTTKEGKALDTGDIAGKEISGHSMYQDGQAFIDGGGYKGLQEQVILAGRYFINPMFVTVEIKPMIVVPIANVGVVIAYVGDEGKDVTGDTFKHGNLVSRGQKGVWVDPLDPGKYAINPYTHHVELVPTANVVLNWATGKNESHMLDKNLSTITVRSSDGFTFNLDVSQIIHIPSKDAPKVIARFGSVLNLVSQVLEPTIGNYFRNTAQESDVIDFLRNRSVRQDDARKRISEALAEYNVVAVDTLIGDITPPEALMTTLTDRKIAEQQKTTFETQRTAQETRKELEQAKAMADTQARVVDAERSVTIAEFTAKAAIKEAEGQAGAKTTNADADAKVLTLVGNAEAGKILAIGSSEAEVVQKKTNAIGAGNYALIETARALSTSGFKLVPDVIAGGGGGSDANSGIVSVLMAGLLQQSLTKTTPASTETKTEPTTSSSPESPAS